MTSSLILENECDVRAVPTVGKSVSRVLAVDDDIILRRLLEKILATAGFDVLLAGDGHEALDIIERELPDLILLDCQMPGIDGFEVCRRIQELPIQKWMPVLFITGLSSSSDKVAGFDAGGVDYITKPIERIELLARVRNHLEMARIRNEKQQREEMLEGTLNSQSIRLEQIRDGQTDLLVDPSQIDGLSVAVRLEPALEAGGDFYDIVAFSDHEFAVLVADISGHDLGVAYLTGALKALTASFVNEALSVDETMMLLNGSLLKFLPRDTFVSAAYAKISLKTQMVDLICAGHPSPLLQDIDGSVTSFDLTGDVLGMHSTIECESSSFAVQRGSRLFLYSDGLIEHCVDGSGNTMGWRSGLKWLADSLVSRRTEALTKCVDGTVEEVLDMQPKGADQDDVVLLGIEF